MRNWNKKELAGLNARNFDLLLKFSVPGILVPGFIPEDVCEEIGRRLRAGGFQEYSHLKNIPVRQIGACQNQYANEPKSVYFEKKKEADAAIEEIYRGLDVKPAVDQVIAALASGTGRPVSIFEEPGFGRYFAGAFRQFRGHGRLHVDHAPSHVKTAWAITEISRQMTWNIYYSVPESGGELVIHDTIHTAEKDRMKVPGDYYFPDEVLDSDERLIVRPKVGDLIIFNTQNFHEILGTQDGYRISQTSFIGLKKDNSLGLWS
jgi:hypothetical protein